MAGISDKAVKNNYAENKYRFNLNEDGTLGAPAFIFLGHELLHAQDLKNGTHDKDINTNVHDPDSKNKGVLTNSEVKTRIKENKIRTENKVIKRALPVEY